MKTIIKDCYFNIFNINPSEKLIKEIKDNLPECILFIVNTFGANNSEVKYLTYLFIHSNYANKK